MTGADDARRRHLEDMHQRLLDGLLYRNTMINGLGFCKITVVDPYRKPGWRARLRNAWSALKGELE